MSVRADVNTLQPLAVIEMFVFDATAIPGASAKPILRFHPGSKENRAAIVWQGITYEPYPVEAHGFEQTAVGKLPRPIIRASNIGGQLAAFMRDIKDGLKAKVTRKRTLGKYLDAVNFPGVGNPNADPNAHFEDEIFFVSRKVVENPIFVEWELAVPFDLQGIEIPRRQVIAGTCQWLYRSPECSYAGAKITTDPVYPGLDVNGDDRCGKTLSSCKLRFGTVNPLKTSAFPASLLARYV